MAQKKIATTASFTMIFFLFCHPAYLQNENKKTILKNSDKAPVEIFYSLNESHSNSWAQCTDDGMIGLCYFIRENIEDVHSVGDLMYRIIQTDDAVYEEVVTTGTHLEISVLLLDSQSNPNIFVASSDNSDQIINHYFKNENNEWESETIIHFQNEGGKFIYELSADLGPNGSFHLLVLKTTSNPDSQAYMGAYRDVNLYHLSNTSGNWEKELIHNYDTFYTIDEYTKSLNRQDISVDDNGFVHVIFGEQISGTNVLTPSHLKYACNATGNWQIETAVEYNSGTRDTGGYYPSLCLDKQGVPHISACYIGRVYSGSAMYAKLIFASRIGENSWNIETIATEDDGYHGSDGRDYTGGITHLVFDNQNNPNIVFTDIASSHGPMNYFNLGNIRYANRQGNLWELSTIYTQDSPTEFFNATEMYGLCLLISKNTGSIQVVGQELEVHPDHSYQFKLTHHIIAGNTGIGDQNNKDGNHCKNQPNPFNASTDIHFTISKSAYVQLNVLNFNGKHIRSLINRQLEKGEQNIVWNATDDTGKSVKAGTYFYQIIIDKQLHASKKMILSK